MSSSAVKRGKIKSQEQECITEVKDAPLFEEQNVFGCGPPIRPFNVRTKERNVAGIRLAWQEQEIQYATITLWNSRYGLIFMHYGILDKSTELTALRTARQVAVDRMHIEGTDGQASLFVGILVLIGERKTLRFEERGVENQHHLLKALLCRAFGYRDLIAPADKVLTADPIVFMGARSLGHLLNILQEAQNQPLLPRIFEN